MDRIYEAYMGGMGEGFAAKTKKRIHWVCDHVVGNNILDVGCSQGITAILLARDGKTVTGLDVCEETIESANSYLAKESEEVQKRVSFKQADFGSYTSDVRYDTIIMGEVLEHLLHPEVFVANAWNHLHDQGTLIVTVPFGINDAPDHKQTFYFFELHHTLTQYFHILETVYFGKWIGFIVRKENTQSVVSPTYTECLQLEQAFYQIEREYITSLQQTKKGRLADREKLKILETKLESIVKEKEALSAELSEKTAEFSQKTTELSEKLTDLVRDRDEIAAELAKKTADTDREREAFCAKIVQLNSVLKSSDRIFASEEKFLEQTRDEIDKLNDQLAVAQQNIDRIEEVLYNTWYGRIAWAAYRFLRKIKRAIFKN